MEARPAAQHLTRPFGTHPALGARPASVSRRLGDRPAGLRRSGRGALRHILVVRADHASSRGVLRPHAFTPRRSTSSTHMRDFQRLPDHYADLYAQQFPRPPDAGRIGEWTPRYMFDPWVMRQLRQVAPAARILVMLPRPRGTLRLCLRTASSGRSAGPVGRSSRSAWSSGEVSRGFYLRQVRRVLDSVPARERPDPAVRALLPRLRGPARPDLGLPSGSSPGTGRRPLHREPAARARPPRLSPQPPRAGGSPRPTSEDAARLAELAPEIDLSLWPSVAD